MDKFIYERGKKNRKMHISKYNEKGEIVGAMCGINLAFNTTINRPFALGRQICIPCQVHSGEIHRRVVWKQNLRQARY